MKNFIRTIKKESLTHRDLKFIKVASWAEPASNHNQTGLKFQKNPLETDSDVMLFVVEREEDNRYMRGGSFSQFGTVYGMPTRVASARMPIDWDQFRPA